jgi:hypothetical protein
MEILVLIVFTLWFGLAITIPIGLFKTSFLRSSEGQRITSSLITAFIVYVPLTFVTFVYITMLVYEGIYNDEKGRSLPLEDILYSFGVVIIYGVIGWLLCSMTNGSLIKPSTIISSRTSEPHQFLKMIEKNLLFIILSSFCLKNAPLWDNSKLVS